MDEIDCEETPNGNPESVVFKKCSVCEKRADPGGYFHSHYGAVCCNGCRLFFHRVHVQVSEGLHLECKAGGTCKITSRGKRWCLKCRFEKCLGVGMDPKKTTTHKQERKLLMKKKKDRKCIEDLRKQMDHSSPGQASSSSTDDFHDQIFPVHIFQGGVKDEESNVLAYGSSENPQNWPNEYYVQEPKHLALEQINNLDSVGQINQWNDNRVSRKQHDYNNIVKGDALKGSDDVSYWGRPPGTLGNSFSCFTFDPFPDPKSNRFIPPFVRALSSEFILPEQSGLDAASQVSQRFQSRRSSEQIQIIQVLDSFTLATSKLKMNFESTQRLVNCHKGLQQFNKTFFISHLSNMMTFVSQFALSQSLFMSISLEDQRTLLRKNLPLYLQYIIARYFNSESGMEQLSWMLEGHIPNHCMEDIQSLGFLEFDEINRTISIFESQGIANEYKFLMKQIKDYFPFPHHYNSLLVNVLLYFTDEKVNLSESRRIQCIFEEGKRFMNLSQTLLDNGMVVAGSKNIEALIVLLKRMDKLFGKSLISPEKTPMVKVVPETLYIPYTDTEELWLTQRLNDLQSNYRSVHLPVDFLQEYIELLSGYKEGMPSRSFMDTWLRMSKERARSVLNIHSEYSELASLDQHRVWKRNHMTAVALTGALLNTTMSGKEQFKGVLGHLGRDPSWERTFSNILHLDRLRPVKLARVNKDVLDDSSMKYFSKLVEEISKLACNEQLFQLMMLVVLLDTDDISSGTSSLSGLVKVRQYYLKLFQRKLYSARCSFIEYSQFQMIVKKLRIFSKMLELFLK